MAPTLRSAKSGVVKKKPELTKTKQKTDQKICSELSAKITEAKALCEKLELQHNISKEDSVIKSQKNIKLKIVNLTSKVTDLTKEVSHLKISNKKLEKKLSKIKSNNHLQEIRQENEINGQTVEDSNLMLLMPNKKSSEKKRFFLGQINGNLINQNFQIESENPFEISPEDTEVILKPEYLNEMKKVVLDSFQSIGETDIIPYISLPIKDMKCEPPITNVIDLTEEDNLETEISNSNLNNMNISKMESKYDCKNRSEKKDEAVQCPSDSCIYMD